MEASAAGEITHARHARQVCDAWLGALTELLPALGREAILSEVLPLALAKGQVDCGVASRVLCCRLLGTLTPWLVRRWRRRRQRQRQRARLGAKRGRACAWPAAGRSS
jgi:hypothetical protein